MYFGLFYYQNILDVKQFGIEMLIIILEVLIFQRLLYFLVL